MSSESSQNSPWQNLNLAPSTLELLQKAGFQKPTPIQEKAIPIALKGRDLIASAQTGSGKTAGFCLPMIEMFRGRKGTYGLILCPTREIALQTHQTIEMFGAPQGICSVPLIGGVKLTIDEIALKSPHHILVGTPGRICDHLERGNLWLEYIEVLVLDEADRMLEMGFANELNRILSQLGPKHQTLLFSATISKDIDRICRRYLRSPERVAVGSPVSAATTVQQSMLWVNEKNKKRELMKIIEGNPGTLIVFTRTKEGATWLYRAIHAAGVLDSTYISSNRRQQDREAALEGFKSGQFRVLIATDVAGRGIHVDNVATVLNYDVPREPNDYIHRIGRTGRVGMSGQAITFVTPAERGLIREILRVVGKKIEEKSTRDFDPDEKSSRHSSRHSSRKSPSRHPRKKSRY